MSDQVEPSGIGRYFIPVLLMVVFIGGLFILYGSSTGTNPQTQTLVSGLSQTPSDPLGWVAYLFSVPFQLIALMISFIPMIISSFGALGYIFIGIGTVMIVIISYVAIMLILRILKIGRDMFRV